MDAKWKVRSVILGAALGVAVLGAPAAAGEGLRVVEVPGEQGCTTWRVMDGDTVIDERVQPDPDDFEEPISIPCYKVGKVLPHRGGIYFRLTLTYLDDAGRPLSYWMHNDGTPDGTAAIADPFDDVRKPVLYRGRLFVLAGGSGYRLLTADPAGVRVVKWFGPYHNVRGLRVGSGLLRFQAQPSTGRAWRNWVSDGTRKGTHVVKR